MKNVWLMLMLPWLLAGCVLESFDLPEDYAPQHPGATAPLADGAMFYGQLDPKKGGEITLRFVKTGTAQYVMEQLAALPDGEAAAVPPAHVRFVPLGDAHYALYWKRLTQSERGYALVRLDPGRLTVLTPREQAALIVLAKGHGIVAKPPGFGGYELDTTDEAVVLGFFKALAARKDLQATTYTSTTQVPTVLRDATLAQLGEHIPQLTRDDLGSETDAAAVVAWARSLASEGNGHGHYLLARFTTNGWGTTVDGPQAIKHAESAIAKGLVQAAHVIAAVHYYGVGVSPDPTRALPFARRAAEAGSPNAMLLLGFAYGNGQGVAEDREEAKRWMRRAADLDFGPAHAQWADLVIAEQTEAGDRAALPALERGIAHNDPRAWFLRGFLHEHGRAGPKDMDAAMEHYLVAAERGDAYSKYLVGYRLRHGQHIAQDIPRGRALLAEAAGAGIEDAKKALAQPDPAPKSNGCEEEWCKNALAFIEKQQKKQEAKLAVAKEDLGKLQRQQAENTAKVVGVQRQLRDTILKSRSEISGTLEMRLYRLQQDQIKHIKDLLALNQRKANLGGLSAKDQAEIAQIRSDLAKYYAGVAEMESRHPLHLAPRLPNGQIVVMRPDGRRVALAVSDSTGMQKLDAAALPRRGDQWLRPEDESALLPYELAWSEVPDEHLSVRKAVSELNQLGAKLDCRLGELAGRQLLSRVTGVPPGYEIDASGTLRYRERFGSAEGLHETEEFIPLSRASTLDHQPARAGQCAQIRVGCATGTSCAVQSAPDVAVRVGVQATLSFNNDRDAARAAVLLREMMGRYALPSGKR